MSTTKKKVIKKASGPVKKIQVANINTHEFRLLDFTFCDSKPRRELQIHPDFLLSMCLDLYLGGVEKIPTRLDLKKTVHT